MKRNRKQTVRNANVGTDTRTAPARNFVAKHALAVNRPAVHSTTKRPVRAKSKQNLRKFLDA